MSEFITLLGAEAVRSAGTSMRDSASEMNRAAASIEDALHRHRLFLDDWIFRLEEVLKSNNPIQPTNKTGG